MIQNIDGDNLKKEMCDKMDTALLQDYLEGTIDTFEKLIVESHLTVCKTCRRELSELKLTFWELGNRNNYEIEYPEELNDISEGLIDKVLGIEEKSLARKVVEIQLNNLRQSKKFIEQIPGAKKTPEIIKKASKSLSKGVAREVKKGLRKIVASK